ncbi:hypothetical protein SAY86_015268 [Trapa natans]|uniref:Uncharacterized protein n=1 Tax=Trapa natans TaxID=22666 RepID=A0AAN7KEG2_TRANT|nr:hypothetical protein SAY86_015268 [Trapa natans]
MGSMVDFIMVMDIRESTGMKSSINILMPLVWPNGGRTVYVAPSTDGPSFSRLLQAGGLDKLTLDSLYHDAIRRNRQSQTSYNPWEASATTPMGGGMMQQRGHDPFFASGGVAAPLQVQMVAMTNQQQAFMMQQQQMMMMGSQLQQPVNPFGNPYGGSANIHPYGPGMPVQAYNPYTDLI